LALVPLTILGTALAQGPTMRDTDYLRTGGARPWWPQPYTADPGCRCWVDPVEIRKPGSRSLFADDTVTWGQGGSGAPIAGVSLDWLTVVTLPWKGRPAVGHGDQFQGDLSNYLEIPSHGSCDSLFNPCPQLTACSFRVSYSIDATNASHDGSVTWTMSSAGAGPSTETSREQNRTRPNDRVVNLSMEVTVGCGASEKSASITWDGGWTQPERTFQLLTLTCTRCSNP
jgi:hypothetical protein